MALQSLGAYNTSSSPTDGIAREYTPAINTTTNFTITYSRAWFHVNLEVVDVKYNFRGQSTGVLTAIISPVIPTNINVPLTNINDFYVQAYFMKDSDGSIIEAKTYMNGSNITVESVSNLAGGNAFYNCYVSITYSIFA